MIGRKKGDEWVVNGTKFWRVSRVGKPAFARLLKGSQQKLSVFPHHSRKELLVAAMQEEVKDMVAAVQYYVENRVAIQHQITAILNEADTAAGMFASGRQLA